MIYRQKQLEESKNEKLFITTIYYPQNVLKLILIVHISNIKKDIDS